MDLNNQMILMRKDIKRAKVWVISKLVRHIKTLRNKRGTDEQKTKNQNRANRLAEEIQMLKDLKPDIVFKFLLTTSMTLKSIGGESNISLNDRACIRIGDVPFVKVRMTEIKGLVADFDSIRSQKDDTTSIKVASKLAKLEAFDTPLPNEFIEDLKEKQDCLILNESSMTNIASASPTSNKASPQKEHFENHFSKRSGNEVEINDAKQFVITQNKRTYKKDQNFIEEEINADEPVPNRKKLKFISKKIEVAFPEHYAKKETEQKLKGIDLSQVVHTNNISDILENVGRGFIEGEEKNLNSAISHDESDSDDHSKIISDPFFMGEPEIKGKDVNCQGDNTTTEITKSFPFQSCFVTSLSRNTTSKINPKNPVGKRNRLGQRARKALYGGTDELPGKQRPNQKTIKDKNGKSFVKRGRRVKDVLKKDIKASADRQSLVKKVVAQKLHPSWMASQARKKQQNIITFEGKKITFEDSD